MKMDEDYDEVINGTRSWHKNKVLHRINGPAVICLNGHQEYYVEGKMHRIGGPAIIHADGGQEWYQNGVKHRIDGPATLWVDGSREWWYHGVQMTAGELFEKLTDEEKEKVLWKLDEWK